MSAQMIGQPKCRQLLSNVVYFLAMDSSDSPQVQHLLTSWRPAWRPSLFAPHTCTRTAWIFLWGIIKIHGVRAAIILQFRPSDDKDQNTADAFLSVISSANRYTMNAMLIPVPSVNKTQRAKQIVVHAYHANGPWKTLQKYYHCMTSFHRRQKIKAMWILLLSVKKPSNVKVNSHLAIVESKAKLSLMFILFLLFFFSLSPQLSLGLNGPSNNKSCEKNSKNFIGVFTSLDVFSRT